MVTELSLERGWRQVDQGRGRLDIPGKRSSMTKTPRESRGPKRVPGPQESPSLTCSLCPIQRERLLCVFEDTKLDMD